MSTTIDERVVSMQFDNSHFEKNVSTTMSSLDKLKQKLNLEGAAKGFENVDSAAKRVNLSGLSAAADTVAVKFSHMQMTIQHQLDRIVDSAVNAGTKLVKSLSVDQITAGWSKYEKKTASIQTIMNATGKSIDEVNQYLNKLMWFSDETSYGFTDMTSGLATMVSSGGDIEKLIPMLMGVANATAFAGKGAAEFSRVLQYGINQAYSLGYMQVQDWKTIEGATVNSKQLMETLIRAGEELGKIKEGTIDTSSFRMSLKDKWLDKDVMEKAFGEFAEMSEKAYEMVQSGEVDTASEAYEILSKKYEGVAITAAKAAQEAKTFTEAIDATKDAVSSGWMRTFEIIFGDYDKAKKQWTDLANLLWDMFASGSEGRNDFLAEVFDSPWDKLVDKLSDAGIETERFADGIKSIVGESKLNKLIAEYGSLEEAVRSGAISSYDLKQALRSVTDNGLSGIVDGLKEIDQVLRRGVKSDDVKKMQTALKELGYDLGEFGENADGIDGSFGPVTKKAIEAFQEAHGLVVDGIAGPETMAALEKAAEELASMSGDVEDLSESCDSLLDVITKRSGRELLFDSLMNVLKAVQKYADAVKVAFGNVFSLSPDSLYSGLKKINDFTKKLVDGGILDAETWEDLIKNVGESGVDIIEFSDRLKKTLVDNGVDVEALTKKYGSLGKAFEDGAISGETIKEVLLSFDGITENIVSGSDAIVDKVRRTFEGVFALVDAIATILSGPLRLVFNVVTKVLKNFGLTVLDITARAGDSLVAFRDKVDEVVDTVSTFIAEHVTKWVEKFKETEFFKTVAQWFEDSSTKISESVDNISQRFANFQATPFVQTLSNIGEFFRGIASDFAQSEFGSGILDGISNTFKGIKKFFTSIPKFTLGDFANIFASLEGADVSGFTGVMGTLGSALKENVFGKVKKFFQNLSGLTWDEFKVNAINKFVTFWTNVGDKVKEAFDACKEVAKHIRDFVFGSEDVKLADILNLAEKILGIIVLIKALTLLSGVIKPFDNITSALDNVASSLKWNAISSTFKSMAIALAALTLCVIAITQIKDMRKARDAAIMLGSLLIIMGGVAVALGFASHKLGSDWSTTGAAISLLAMVGAIVLLVKAIKDVDAMDLRDPVGTFGMITGALLAMVIGMSAVSKAGGSSFKSIAAVLTLITALKMLLDVITAYDEYDWTGKSIAIKRMTEMLFTLSAALAVASIGSGASVGMAFTLLAMVFSLKLILNAIKEFANVDDATMEKGGLAVVKLLGIMSMMVIAMSIANDGTVLQKGERSVNNFTGLAVALLAVVGAIYLLGKMATENEDILLKGGNAVGQILLAFTAMLTAVGLSTKGLSTGTIVTMLIMFGLLIAEVAIIVKQLESVPWESTVSTVGSLSGMLLAMAFVLSSLSKCNVSSANILKWVAAFAGLTIILWALSEVLKPMNSLDAKTTIANAASLSILLTVLTGAMAVCVAMGKVCGSNVSGMMGCILGVAALGLVVWEIGAIIRKLSDAGLNESAIGAVAAISIMLAVMTGVMVVCGAMGTVLQNPMVMLGLAVAVAAIGLLGLVVWEIGAILRKLSAAGLDESAIGAVAVISAMLVVMTGVMAVCAALATILQNPMVMLGLAVAVAAIALLGLVVWEIGAILRKLKANGLDENAIGTVNVLSAMMVALTGVLAACALIGLLGPGVFGAVAAMALLGLVAWEIGAIVRKLNESGLSNAMPTVAVLSVLLGVLTDALGKLAIIGLLTIPALGAIAGLGILAAELFLVMLGLSAIKDTETAKTNVDTICALLTNLTSMILLISLAGTNALIAVAALDCLVTLVGKLTLFAAAIGTLQEWFGNGDTSVIESGMDLLIMVAGKLGEMLGAFGVGLSSSLSEIGGHLSAFVSAAEPFIELVGSIDNSVLAGAGYLAGAVIAMLTADFIAAIASIGGLSLTSLAVELSSFADNIGGFISAMKEIDPECASGIEALCDALGTFLGASFLDAIGDKLLGGDTLGSFGESIATFATCIKDAADDLSEITDEDVANIQRSATAGTALAELNQSIPRQDGWLQDFLGRKDLAAFGEAIDAFADCIVSYSAKVSGKAINADAITTSATAGKALAELNGAIPSQGGWAQVVLGSKELTTFGDSIVAFGQCLVDYSAIVSGGVIDADAITTSATAAKALADLNASIPKQGGWAQTVLGEQDMTTFGNSLVVFGTGLAAFANSASQIDDAKIAAITKSGQAMDEINLVIKKIPDSGGWGDKIFGSSDGASFGTALTTLATGLSDYCTAVSVIDFSTAVKNIQSSKSVVIEMGNVLNAAPSNETCGKATQLKTAAENVSNVASIINRISNAGYNYSGIVSLKTHISMLISIVAGIDAGEIKDRFKNLNTAVESAADCSNKLVAMNDKTYTGVSTFKTALSSLSGADIDSIINAFSGKAEVMADAIETLVSAMADGFTSASDRINTAIASVIGNGLTELDGFCDNFKAAGRALLGELASGLKDALKLTEISNAGKTAGERAVVAVKEAYSRMHAAGEYLVDGFAAGITARTWKAEAKAKAMADAAIEEAKETLAINSPSKVFRAIGYSVPEGFAMGIDRMSSMATTSSKNMANGAINNVRNSISRIADLVSTDIDSQPTIRPVLDLSEVRTGAGAINGMLGGTRSLNMAANVGSIASMMNERSQNGANDDVIRAINGLSDRLDNVGNTSYNINGVTYDDGSNISEAMKTIVRQVRIERRV